MNDLVAQNWYQTLISDCKAIITEAIFTSRWALVEGYWRLGQRIKEDLNFQKYAKNNYSSLTHVSKNIGIGYRDIYRAIQLYEKYRDLNSLPEGKNITWKKLITKYLPKLEENSIELPIPEGLYNVIVIDPPWPYGTEYDKDARRVASPYPELSIEELAKMKLPSADDCVLWLWTTHKFIFEAKKLMDAWGFEYKLTLVWDKQKLGIGKWLRCQVEFCLLGIKGNPEWNLTNERDLIREARKQHSRKPEAFYKLVERLTGPKIDIFGRFKRQGWAIYGNEINC